MRSSFILFVGIYMLCTSCQNNVVFEKNLPINCNGWELTDTMVYEVNITDIHQKYDISLNMRHRDIYEYTNIYLNVLTEMPNEKEKKEVISLPLCDDGGKWYGNCSGDVCFQRVYIMKKVLFPIAGKYIFRINQEMRTAELKNVFDLGLRIEKSIKKPIKEDA